MVWFFITVTILAIALMVIRAADQGQSLAAAMVFTAIFCCLLGMFFGGCFCIAYLLGATEKAIERVELKVQTPFADGTLPDQIIPPNNPSGDQ